MDSADAHRCHWNEGDGENLVPGYNSKSVEAKLK